MDKIRKNEIKRNIEKCFMERLIYDIIYKENELVFDTQVVEQDEGHRHRMEETLKDFRSCFPNVDLNIHIDFDMHLPIRLSVTKSVNGRVIIREEYTKEIVVEPAFGGKKYSDFVQCIKVANNTKYVRVQTYSGPLRRWVRCVE